MPYRRRPSAWIRFGFFLAREFRWPAGVFIALVLLGGLFMETFYPGEPLGYVRACYAIFCMIFFEMGVLEFPREWYLQPFFFLVPIIGLGAVADSVVRLGYFIFTSKQKLPEWHRMNASAMRNHIVLCGVGKVGYRILKELLALREEVVAIEKNGDSPLVAEMLDQGVPILIGEARLRKTLEEANVRHAKAVILATDDDLANLDAALTAREIKPDVRVVVRLFDDTLATKVATAFNMPAISTSTCAASSFVAAATERTILQSFQLGGQKLHVADLRIVRGSRLASRTIGDLQREFDVNVVMHLGVGSSKVNPGHEVALKEGDHLMLIAPIERLTKLEEANR